MSIWVRAASSITLSSLKSPWTIAGVRGSGGRCAASHARAHPSRAASIVFERCQRSVQPRTWRSTKPAGLPRREAARVRRRWHADRPAYRQRPADARRHRALSFNRRRLLVADDDAVPALHDVEHRADDRGSSHESRDARREREDRMHRREPAELARHVVRGRRHRPERRTPNDDLDIAEAKQVGEVRVAAGKLRHLHGSRRSSPGISHAGRRSRSHATSRGHSSASPERTGVVSGVASDGSGTAMLRAPYVAVRL